MGPVKLGRVVVAVAAGWGSGCGAWRPFRGGKPERRELFEDLLEVSLVLGRDRLLLVVGVGSGVLVGHRGRVLRWLRY